MAEDGEVTGSLRLGLFILVGWDAAILTIIVCIGLLLIAATSLQCAHPVKTLPY